MVKPYSNDIKNMSKTHIQTLVLELISVQPRGRILFKTDYKEIFQSLKMNMIATWKRMTFSQLGNSTGDTLG